MTTPKCPRFDNCNSPLCPMDERRLEHGIWYPDEDICGLKAYANLTWIRAQKKIARVGARADRYFILTMLGRDCVIKKGLEGLHPDEEEGPQLKAWVKKHPRKRVLSKEEKAIVVERLARKKSA